MNKTNDQCRKALLVQLCANGKVLRTFAFDQDAVFVGRDRLADVHLPGLGISRIHCKIEREHDSFTLVDNGSTNGTWLNKKRVRYAELHTDDHVQIGGFTLRVAIVSTKHDNPFVPDPTHSTPTLRAP